MQPTYDNSVVLPHPDDEDDITPPDREFSPLEGESMADVLRRVGAIAKGAKRLWQAMDAKDNKDHPDYRARIEAVKQVRDTVEGTPDKKPQPVRKDADGKPEPGALIRGKGKAGV